MLWERANTVLAEHWKDGIEILLIALVFYAAWRYIRRIRGAKLLIEFLLVLATLTTVSKVLDLEVLSWLIRSFAIFFLFGLMIIFQPELRRAVVELERLNPFEKRRLDADFAEEIAEATRQLSGKRYGALLALQRGMDLEDVLETGVKIDATLSPELALTIFHPKTALHDGGVILRGGRIEGAACLFPVSQRELMDRSLGLRHRAALGLTEETDAIVVIVSEETGTISLAVDGELERPLTAEILASRLRELLAADPNEDDDDNEKAKLTSSQPSQPLTTSHERSAA